MNISKIKILLLTVLFSGFMVNAQTKAERNQITKNYDKALLTQMANDFAKMQQADKEKALQYAKEHNLPVKYVNEVGQFCELMKLNAEGKPVYYATYNKNAAKSTRANFLHNGGGLGLNIEGQNMTGYVWDGGVALVTHQEFTDDSGNTRITLGDTDADTSDHGTHVIGTVIAKGVNPNAKGMAPQAHLVSYDWGGDLTEATIEASNGMLLSNHSYGPLIENVADWQFGAYTGEARHWDLLLYQAPYYQMVAAAGNDGYVNYENGDPLDGNSGFDKLSGHVVAKNTLAVANGNDLAIDANGDPISTPNLDGSSSQGPTDDYRIKPDITGNGVFLTSSIDASNSSYASYTGTSMASPNVMGTLLILQQLYMQEKSTYMLSATLRGLAKHTADDGGLPGPDAKMGWGYLNAKKSAEIILNDGDTAEVEELDLQNGETYSFQVTSDGTNPLIASISWTDKQSNNVNVGNANDPTPVLVNDLDLRVTKGSTTYEPWKLTGVNSNTKGDNIVDNFERVDVDNASGTYTVTVSHKGNLEDGHQAYSIIITGITGTNMGVEAEKATQIKIWPNPGNGKFSIFVNESGHANLTVTDLLGKQVYSESFSAEGNETKDVDLSNLVKGVYLINFRINHKITTTKLILE